MTRSDSEESSSEDEHQECANLCLMAHEDEAYITAQGAKRRWYLDSDCLRHMMDDKEQFVTLETKGGIVTFRENDKGHIIRFGKIQITPSIFFENVLDVKGLKHNLISISQLCDKCYKVSFESLVCIITNPIDDSIVFISHRQSNIYMIDLN